MFSTFTIFLNMIQKSVAYGTYEKIYSYVRCVPKGMVATYGKIASMIDRCTPRMVGYAMAHLSFNSDVPWHRIVNRKGEISIRSDGSRCDVQKLLLVQEGVIFNEKGQIDLSCFGWTKTR